METSPGHPQWRKMLFSKKGTVMNLPRRPEKSQSSLGLLKLWGESILVYSQVVELYLYQLMLKESQRQDIRLTNLTQYLFNP